MSKWRNEVEAAMNSIINDISSVQAAFVTQETLVLLVDILEYGTEAV